MRSLLDVNVLIALLDVDHAHHLAATAWLSEHLQEGWASCPLTQNGCVRIMSQPGYPNPLQPAQVAMRLAEAARGPRHEFWPDRVSLLDADAIDLARLLGPRQVADAYLLALAVAQGGRFVTFDRAVPVSAVRGAKPQHLFVI